LLPAGLPNKVEVGAAVVVGAELLPPPRPPKSAEPEAPEVLGPELAGVLPPPRPPNSEEPEGAVVAVPAPAVVVGAEEEAEDVVPPPRLG
jgi:hypothetical protein